MGQATTFRPHYGTNQVVTPAAGAASITINKNDHSVRVVNSGAAKGYFRIGTAADSPVATVADCCVAAGGSVIVEKAEGQDTLSHISATGTTFEVMTGEGGI